MFEDNLSDLKPEHVSASARAYVDSTPLDIKDFGEWLKALREEKGLTLTQLGDLIGYSNPYLSQIETGKRKNMPSPEILEKLSTPLGTRYSDLLQLAGYEDLAKGVQLREAKEIFTEGWDEDYDIFQLREQVEFIEHVTDIKRFLEANFFHTENGGIKPKYNGHPLTDQDRTRILDMLKALFPDYQT